MSELLKRVEAAEIAAKERADQCELLKAELATAKAEVGEAVKSLGVKAEEATAQAAQVVALMAELQAVKTELETAKARLALAPGKDLGAGDEKPVGAGVASDPIDHKKVYASIQDPRKRAEYRNEFGKELGICK
jgi:hypothetical protein